MTTTNITFQLRRDTTTNWNTFDPILSPGEIGIDTTLNKFKIGKGGAFKWSDLDYGSILASELTAAINTHNNDTTNVHGIADTTALATKTYVDNAITSLSNTSDITYIPVTDFGNADGVATLDSTGKIPVSQLGNIIDAAPAALDTLNELAAALGDNANFATSVTNSISTTNTNVSNLTTSVNTLSSTVTQFDARIVSLELGLGI